VTAQIYHEVATLSRSERLLLDLIWREGPISRKDLAEKAEVTGATTTRLTRRLIELELVEEMVLHDGTVGNPSRPLKRFAKGAYSVGVSFERHHVHVGISDLTGQLIAQTSHEVDQVTLDEITQCVRSSILSNLSTKEAKRRIIGIGLAMPGYHSEINGEWALHWDFPDLLRHDIVSDLTHRLELPVYAERDAIAAALGERLHGAGREDENYFYIYMAQGLGGCLMLAGRPYHGAHGNAGGLSVLFPQNAFKPSANQLLSHLKAAGYKLNTVFELRPSDMIQNDALDNWLDEAAFSLLPAIEIISRLYDPQTILLGGQLPTAILRALHARLKLEHNPTNYTARLKVPNLAISALDGFALLVGAAAIPISQMVR
jgi:predicted NBD/HSP70 family sugar kinase